MASPISRRGRRRRRRRRPRGRARSRSRRGGPAGGGAASCEPGHVRERRLAQRHAERALGGLALRAPLRVGAPRQRPPAHRSARPPPRRRRATATGSTVERRAVDEQGVAGDARRRGQLVHHAARYAARHLLRLAGTPAPARGASRRSRAPGPPPPPAPRSTTGPRRSAASSAPCRRSPARGRSTAHDARDVARPRRLDRRGIGDGRGRRRPSSGSSVRRQAHLAPGRAGVPSTVVPRSMAIGSTSPPV